MLSKIDTRIPLAISELEGKPGSQPVQRIPQEILALVFLNSLAQWHPGCDERRQAMLSLCLVCTRWRQAVLMEHSLWKDVCMQVEQMGSYEGVSGWLGRAGCYPKTLNVLDTSDDYLDDDLDGECPGETLCVFHHPTFLKLLSDGPTLDHLGLLNINTACFQHLLKRLGAFERSGDPPWRSVRSLELRFRLSGAWPLEHDDIPSHSIFFSLPPIRSLDLSLPLHFDSVIPWNRAFALNIPPSVLRRLTSLRLQLSWGFEHVFAILQHCSNLTELEFDTVNCWMDSEHVPARLQQLQLSGLLPALQILQIRNSHPDMSILDYLVAPALRGLDLSFHINRIYCDDKADVEELAAAAERLAKPLLPFLSRSNCATSLIFLRLHNRTLEAAELVQVLSNLPFLVHLSLDAVNTDYWTLWDSLTQPTLFLLDLRRLDFTDVGPFTNADVNALANFLHSPHRVRHTQVTLALSLMRGLSLPPFDKKDIWNATAELRKRGIPVEAST